MSGPLWMDKVSPGPISDEGNSARLGRPGLAGEPAQGSGSPPLDTHLFHDINRLAQQTAWAHGFASAFAVWIGLLLLGAIAFFAYLRARSGLTGGGPRQVAATLWTPLAAAIAFELNQPLSHAINRPRPYQSLSGVEVLIHRAMDPGLPSDHATVAGAVLVGCFLARDRLAGVLATVVALLLAFDRVYVGAHYPGDVLAGLGFGAVVTLIGSIVAVPLLERLVAAVSRSPFGFLVAPGSSRRRIPSRLGSAAVRPLRTPEEDASRATEAGPAARPRLLSSTGAVRLIEGHPLSPRPPGGSDGANAGVEGS
ncbi:MAG: Undecaprenyl-diphosphatase [Acidimicrobiaceae bacterium]|nr:Undecaprenyl-diphosphatase [Acidimicrobiaceae bacterium]